MKVSLTLSEGRARMIASECPLTWRQVILLAYQSHEETQLWDHAHWLQWGPTREVGEWLWSYWVDHAGEATDDLTSRVPTEFPVSSAPRPMAHAPTASHAIARGVGQKPWRAWLRSDEFPPLPEPGYPGSSTSAAAARWPESCPAETLMPGGCDDAD